MLFWNFQWIQGNQMMKASHQKTLDNHFHIQYTLERACIRKWLRRGQATFYGYIFTGKLKTVSTRAHTSQCHSISHVASIIWTEPWPHSNSSITCEGHTWYEAQWLKWGCYFSSALGDFSMHQSRFRPWDVDIASTLRNLHPAGYRLITKKAGNRLCG